MDEELITPNLEWARKVAREHGVETRCPYAHARKCPRYFESLSLLGEAGRATAITRHEDEALLRYWRASELWPEVTEKASAVSGSEDRKSFTKFCPEVSYDHFGYFASGLFPYGDDIDLEFGIQYWAKKPVRPGHWYPTWSAVTPLHYTDCPLYSVIKTEGQRERVMPEAPDQGLVRKIAVLGKDFYSLRSIDDLFIFAGAVPEAKRTPRASQKGGERMDRVYGWVEGLEELSPERVNEILAGVAAQIADNEAISETDRAFLRQKGGGQAAIGTTRSTPPSVTPQSIDELLERIIKGIPRAIQPLRHRREGAVTLDFSNEYDIQTLFHALIAPWVRDIRPEEYTPSYAGKSRRVDFLLAEHELVVELKFVRDRRHGRRVGEELIVDIAHYAAHPKCQRLWAVVHDPHGFVQNPDGLIADLEGERSDSRGRMSVRVWVLQP